MAGCRQGGTPVIATMNIRSLLEAAASVGLRIELVDDQDAAQLYAWVTPEGEVIYVGKAASSRRFTNEAACFAQDPTHELFSAFVALVRRNHGRCHPLRLIGFEAEVARGAVREWSGGAFDTLHTWLEDERELSAEDAETLLIRIVVRCGVPTGNARSASLWDHPLGTPLDTLAAVAASEVLRSLVVEGDGA